MLCSAGLVPAHMWWSISDQKGDGRHCRIQLYHLIECCLLILLTISSACVDVWQAWGRAQLDVVDVLLGC